MHKKQNKLVETIISAIQDKKGQNIVVADFDYQAALFLFKNKHPDLDTPSQQTI